MTEPDTAQRTAVRPGRDWVRAARGLYLVGIGAALLLNTTGGLPWAYWIWLLDWWPMILVAAGVRLVFDRSRLPALVLLSPVLGLGTMALVAIQGAPVTEDGELRGPLVRIARPADLPDWRLDVSMALADLEVETGDGTDLISGQSAGSHSRLRLNASRSGRSVHAWAGWPSGRWTVWPGGGARARTRLQLAPDVPLALDLRGGLSRFEGDLRRIPLRRVSAEGGFCDLDLRLGAPIGRVPLRFAGAFSSIVLRLPAGTRVDVTESGALNSVAAAGGDLSGEDAYRVVVEGAFQSLEIVEE